MVRAATKSRANGSAAPATVRVAIYTRKSTDEGLDQEFNSLDAQRQAVEAYVTSQKGEGWAPLPERYDDGGYTGANTERPAFRRLLADIEAGRVDVVAVYKIDRLSRSLLDFVRLMEAIRQHGVTFVSVTQQFSTTNPVGRMTLNLLATFAEFERETIAERTRDKIAAARRRGMWTGGRPPLGYDLVQRKLVVNEAEAETVRAIFGLYMELKGLMPTVEDLNRRGHRTKSWRNARGRLVSGGRWDKSSLRRLLKSPVYVGRVGLGADTFPGQHEAIVDEALWNEVQAKLSGREPRARGETRNRHGLLLRGLLVCGACGSAMSHSFASRGERRWSYYVCNRSQKQGARACPGSRVAVGEIESFVVERVRAIGADPALQREVAEAAQLEREARLPELRAEARRHEAERRRIVDERGRLVEAIAQGGAAGGALVQRVAELDDACAEAAGAAAAARSQLTAVEVGTIDEAELQAALEAFEPVWAELFPRERARVLSLLVEQVSYVRSSGAVEIRFRPSGLRSLAGGGS